MNIEIKHRITQKIIICGEYESIKDCLEKNTGADLTDAYLRGADLRGADLRGADLRGAYLGGADLRGADYNGEKLLKEPTQLLGLKYFVMITKEQIKIGCELHKVKEWEEFDDKRILKMDGEEGLSWWRGHKKIIFEIHKLHITC